MESAFIAGRKSIRGTSAQAVQYLSNTQANPSAGNTEDDLISVVFAVLRYIDTTQYIKRVVAGGYPM